MSQTIKPKYIAAFDQGTTSTRCIIFNHDTQVMGMEQREHRQIFPRAGWVEHDPVEIFNNVLAIGGATIATSQISTVEIAAIGITNQRETTVLWNKETGEPVYNAIVWQDTRTADFCNELIEKFGKEFFVKKTGLHPSTYFSGPKIRWIMDNVDGVREKIKAGRICFGNMDSWLIWNLTKNSPDGPLHITDPTNASRTLLMNLETLEWDDDLCNALEIPKSILPTIHSSSEVYGKITNKGLFKAPIAGILGDQQAATFGQACTKVGEAKCTYGTGGFLLFNTGQEIKYSTHGLLSTVCYKLGKEKPVYALEGSIAVAGSLIQWLRDNLGLIKSAEDVEGLAETVADNGGAYLVPAFSGLFAPRWRSDARGVIVGLTRFINKGHIARAALESTAYQTREVIEAMNADAGRNLTSLKVDGGMVNNDLLMQFQADILDETVIRPKVVETTTLGAAYAAGLAVGFWESVDEIRSKWVEGNRWEPKMPEKVRDNLYADWNRAVERTFDWNV